MNRFTGPLLAMAMLCVPGSAFADNDWSFGVSGKMNDGYHGVAHYKHDSQTGESEYWVHTGPGHKTKKEARQEAKAEVADKNEEGQGPIVAEKKKEKLEKKLGKDVASSESVKADPADTCRLFPDQPGCQIDIPIGGPGQQNPGE